MSEDKSQKMEELMNKVADLKKSGNFDLSLDEDLSIAIMNLVSLEEHFFFTAEKTGKDEYLDLLNEVRIMRRDLLAKMMTENEGESWCISKHMLAAAMRLMEVGTKLQTAQKEDEARDMFKKAYHIYSMFWALRLKLIDLSNVKKISDNQLNVHDNKPSDKPWSVEDIVGKLVDCCDEGQNHEK